jgi:hypothetical protein
MDEMLLRVYRSQVRGQCEFALMAATDINAGLDTYRTASESLRNEAKEDFLQTMQNLNAAKDRIWFSLNAFLNAVANVSKLLWPHPKRKTAKHFPARGKELREALGVACDSPLQYRTVRNHFEHVDERIEAWWLKSERHNIASRTMGTLEGIEGLEQNEFFEQFDPDQLIVAFQGDVFELQPIADEIATLHIAICEAEKAP